MIESLLKCPNIGVGLLNQPWTATNKKLSHVYLPTKAAYLEQVLIILNLLDFCREKNENIPLK